MRQLVCNHLAGTAAGMYDLRRLQVGRCGELTWALLAPDCCPYCRPTFTRIVAPPTPEMKSVTRDAKVTSLSPGISGWLHRTGCRRECRLIVGKNGWAAVIEDVGVAEVRGTVERTTQLKLFLPSRRFAEVRKILDYPQ